MLSQCLKFEGSFAWKLRCSGVLTAENNGWEDYKWGMRRGWMDFLCQGWSMQYFRWIHKLKIKKNANDLPLPESTILMAVYSLLCNGPETVAVSSTWWCVFGMGTGIENTRSNIFRPAASAFAYLSKLYTLPPLNLKCILSRKKKKLSVKLPQN